LLKPIEVRIGEKWAIAEPCDRLEIHGTVEFDHPFIGFQEAEYIEGKTPFSEIAPARTFGFFKDVQALRRMGLTLGGSLENAVVLDEVAIMNPEGLRFGNEFARHKVLDALGDFCLAGSMLSAKIRLHRAGHDLHRKLLEEWFKDAANFDGGPLGPVGSESATETVKMAARALAAIAG
jgi:UDP-3-O-[3-hydroxymyristoyl] N-acetylglucosamine deacetylase